MKPPPPELHAGGLVVPGRNNVDTTSVTLRFFGEELEPDRVTRALGLQPTRARQRGDAVSTAGTEQRARTGSWLLSGEQQSRTPLPQQIEDLFARLPAELDIWRDLTGRYRGDLFCGLWCKTWNRGLELPPSVLRSVAERGLHIAFDIYYLE